MVFFRYLGTDESSEDRIRRGIEAAGVALSPLPAAPFSEGVIILCFDEIDSQLLVAMHQYRGQPKCRVLALAASAGALESGAVWRVLHAGASDAMAWDERTPGHIAARVERWQAVERWTLEALAREPLAGVSAGWQRLVRRVVEAGRFSDAPVLLSGESGTGKELLARVIHAAAVPERRRTVGAELVTVDCGAMVPELSGSELFGHERGAFTGAHAARDGAFALANGGTLFLDEIGELPLALQTHLLRAIQEKTYKPVGGNVWLKTEFRLVCATNRDLPGLVAGGQFRLDLYHRIAGWAIRTIPLRERREDILPLARHFLGSIAPQAAAEFDPIVGDYLLNRPYPGNIRELRQLVERMAHLRAGAGPITAGDIPEEDRPAEGSPTRVWPDQRFEQSVGDALTLGATLREISAATTAAAIRIAVQSENGNLQRAAKRLGVTDRALQMRRAAGALPD